MKGIVNALRNYAAARLPWSEIIKFDIIKEVIVEVSMKYSQCVAFPGNSVNTVDKRAECNYVT